MRKTLKPEVAIPWSGKTIKEFLYRPIMKAQLGAESTTKLSSKDIDRVYDTLNRHLGEKFGITVAWPSEDEVYYNRGDKSEEDTHI